MQVWPYGAAALLFEADPDEIRTVAADHLWMSPQHERDTVAVHFTCFVARS